MPHQDASAVERHLRIRQLVGDQRDRDQGVDPELLAAVKRIQRGWRRRMAVIRRKQSLSAIRIQSAWRGYVARETVKEMLEDRATSQNIGHGVWFLDAHRGRRQGSAKESKRPASRAARMSRLSMMAGLGGDTQRRSSAAGRLTSSGGDALVSLPVRAWVKDAPEVARREGEEVQRRVMAMQAHKAKVREQRRAERRRQMRDRRLRRGLPRWFIWPTYILCGIFCAVAIWFIILYGLSFPPAIARAWLLSSLFAVFVELFVQVRPSCRPKTTRPRLDLSAPSFLFPPTAAFPALSLLLRVRVDVRCSSSPLSPSPPGPSHSLSPFSHAGPPPRHVLGVPPRQSGQGQKARRNGDQRRGREGRRGRDAQAAARQGQEGKGQGQESRPGGGGQHRRQRARRAARQGAEQPSVSGAVRRSPLGRSPAA